jgi:hypothetical protein
MESHRNKYIIHKISMVRVRNEKDAASAPAPAKSSGNAKSSKKSRSGDAVLEEQVLALGGTKADYDLVKNSKESTAVGSLTSDVSRSIVCCCNTLTKCSPSRRFPMMYRNS